MNTIYALAVFLLALLLLLAVLVVRALRFRPSREAIAPLPAPGPAAEEAAAHLAGAVRFPTISYDDVGKYDRQAFLGLHDYLARSFPRVQGAEFPADTGQSRSPRSGFLPSRPEHVRLLPAQVP